MPDIPFKFRFQPDNPAEHAARMAVLYRLTQPDQGHPRCPTSKEEWEVAFNRLLACWRFRVWDLCQLGVYRFESNKIQRMRNCHPWGVGVESYRAMPVHCRRRDICPWCTSRDVSELYTLLRRILREGDSVLTATYADYFDSDPDESLVHEFIRARLERYLPLMRSMVRANQEFSRAAAWAVTVEPPVPGSARPLDFCIRARLLLVLPVEAEDYLLRPLPQWQINRIHNPDESTCQKLIAQVYAYPTGLLLGTPEATRAVLNAKIGMRLNEISGALRGQPAEIVDV